MVRLPLADLNTVEQAVQALNAVSPQVHIKTRFFEVPKGTAATFGNLGNTTNVSTAGFAGILSEKNSRAVYNSLKGKVGVEIWGEPEVVTTSGRQAQIRATQVVTVVTNFLFQDSLTNNGTSAIIPQTGPFETGPIVDVVPRVLADGFTINLSVVTSLTEFLGYANAPSITAMTGTNNRVQLPVILPRFNQRRVAENVNLWDGQTAMLGGMSMKNVTKDKSSGLGSVPLLGRMFYSLHTNETEIIVFVTATIVDPAGNRVHAEGELPFAQDKIPPPPPPPK